MKMKYIRLYIYIMMSEATRPIGTKFRQRIDGELVQVSRIRHLIYLHYALVEIFRMH